MLGECTLLFYIPSTKHLAESIAMPKGTATFGQFTDGEWHVHIHDKVKDQTVWVLAQTSAPTDTMIQLLLLCDALQRAGASINLFISYMGYARQDRAFDGQALSCQVMCNLIELCHPKALHALQLHNPLICAQYFANHIPYAFFNECAEGADVIVAPDKGAASWAGHIASAQFKQLICIEKHRPEPEKVIMKISGDVQGKRALIVDDMITTGSTILLAAQLLFEHGATSVRVASAHGLFTGDAREKLEGSKIEKIYVTNSLLQKQTSASHRSSRATAWQSRNSFDDVGSGKITVIDIAPFIEAIMQE